MMTYDSKRQRVVLLQQSHAGRDGMEVLEWDGQQWTRFEGPVTPRIRGNGAWCYDAVRGVCVLFGGHWWNAPVLGDTWLWDGRRWTEVNTATSPPARFDGKSCFDASLGRVVMFGGEGRSNGQPNLLGDLWSFDGSNWGLESSGGSGAPVPRNLHAVFYDTLVGEVVLFGGYVGNNAFVDDTWSWRRSQGWRRLATNGAPSPRGWHSVAFDTNRGRGILYGQYLGWNNEETWEWGSSSRAWTLLTKAPPGGLRRQGVAMTWDGAAVVLYGGIANYEFGVNNPQSDLFSWNPASKSWSRSTPSAPHGSRFQMATDPVRNTLVAYPSWESSGTIWERSGGVWKSFVPTSQTLPSGRWYPALASDGRGGVILFGGERGANFQNDAWRFDGTTWMPVAAGPSARSRVAA
ncbi:MAG: hypothetical protein KDC95_07560, partial [Planctomycetes bacterium]|nr:hypothetical protein [Planctomycetota bacterium]